MPLLKVLEELTGLQDAPRIAKTVMALMPDTGVLVVDRDLHVVLMEGSVFERHGYDLARSRDRDVRELMPAAAWGEVGDLWAATLAGTSQTIERESQDGVGVYLTHFAPLKSKDGGLAGAIMVAHDITERARAREAAEVQLVRQVAVSSLGSLALTEPTIEALLQRAAETLHMTLGGNAAGIYEFDEDGASVMRAFAGEQVMPERQVAHAANDPSFASNRVASALLSGDIRVDSRFATPQLQAQGMVSLVAAPIGVGDASYGSLGACSREPGAYTEDDLAFVQSVANVVGAAVDRERALSRATQAESRIASLWDLSLDPLAVFTPDGLFAEVNAAWERTLGWSREELLGRPAMDFVHPDDRERTIAIGVLGVVAAGQVAEVVNRYLAKDGSSRWLMWSVTEGPDGHIYGVAKDISERYEERELALHREERLNEAQRIGHMGSWETDIVSHAFTVSPSLSAMLALDGDRVSIDDLLARMHPGDRARLADRFAEFEAGSVSPITSEFRMVLPDGSERIFASHAEPVVEDDRVVMVRGLVQDVTEPRARELALRRSEERFRQGFEGSPIGMALVDPATRGFTRVNDALCRFLGRTAAELETLTVTDVTHPDGQDGDIAILEALATGVRTEHGLEKRYVRADGAVVWAALSVSAALDADGSVDVLFAQLLDITERKEREEAVHHKLDEVAWLSEIRKAFAEDRFELHGQPVVDLASGEVVQHELLIRMRDRAGRLIPPGEFLPAAEKYGPILEIDRWVICRAAQIAAGGMDVAVNVSGVSLGDPTLVSHVERELGRWGAEPGRLVIEITETALIAAGPVAGHVAEQLRELGCRFALDDFGTGFGGFQHLKSLPLDFLKIDQEFVRDASTDESDRHVIAAVVSLAKGFGLQTVAEGVEDAETLTLLAEMGVDLAQGYHLGRPAPLAGDPGDDDSTV